MNENREIVAVRLFAGGGEMGALMRSRDWSKTPLGAVETWSQSLKTAVRIMLTSRQAMFVWWGEELINLYNDAYKAIVGGKHPQALGQPAAVVWREIWDRIKPRAESATLNNEGTYDEALLLIMERNGYPEETYYTFSYSPIPDDEGKTGGILCANTDDTERIVGERQLTLLRELAANTADARTLEQACSLSASCLETNPYDLPFAMIYLVDFDRQSISLAGTCGINSDRAAGLTTVGFDSDSVWSFARVIETQQSHLVTDLAKHFDNLPTGAWEIPPHQAVVVPIAPSGQTGRTGILVVGLNPFRLFDDNYSRFIDLVAAQISASIANANAYEEERKRAEALAELDRAKTAFFSNVSHEFRTPLTLILGPLAELLASHSLPKSDRQQLETVYRNSQRLLKLVNTLLDFSRIEAGRIQAVYEPTDLSALTTELASVFRSTIEQAGIRLIVDCPPLPEVVYIDREMWEKALFNLLSNAFKFTFAGEISVRLRWRGDYVELDVQDTGIGIPASEIPHLFERFHRVKGARGRSFEGSGIGLSLVQELVRLHGGVVKVTSTEGKGSCFTATIPTGSAHLPCDRISAPRPLTATNETAYLAEALRWLPDERSEAGGDPPQSPLSPLPYPARILVADDNADMRDYLKRLLCQQYQVETVVDGTAALTAIAQNPPDLVLTDVMMPGMDGFSLLRALRADPTTCEIPIILLSARAGEEARVEGLEAGADDYLIKPFSARELLARVEANLQLVQLRQAAAQQEQLLRLEAEAAKNQVEAILSSIGDGFFVLDRDWRYTYVSDRLLEIINLSRADVIGQCVWDVFPEAVGSEYYQHLQQAMSEQTSVQFETFYAPWNRWFENRVYPNSDNSLSIFCADITQRKQADHRLQLYADVVRNAQVGIVVWQLETPNDAGSFRLLIANLAASEATGINFEQVIGSTMAENFPILLQTPLVQQYINVVRTGQPLDLGEVSYSADGITAGIYSLKAFALPDSCLGLAFENITTRKQIEAQLQASQHYSQQIVEAMPGIVFVQDLLDGRNIYTSPQITDLLGYSADRLQTMGADVIANIIHPDDIASLSSYLEKFKTAPENTVLGVEYRVRHTNGQWRWIYSQSVVFERTVQGLAQQILGISLDITDRKQVEESLQQREAELRLITNAVPVLISFVDTKQRYRYNNQRYEQWFGYSAGELYGKLLWEVLGATAYAIIQPYVERVLAGEQVTFESYVPYQDGSNRYVEATYVPQLDAQGQVIGYVAAINDISDRKLAEAALRQSEERYRFLITATAATVWTANPEGAIIEQVPWWETFTGQTYAQYSGFGWIDAVHPEDRQPTLVLWTSALQQKTSVAAEYRLRRHDGQYRYMLSQAVPLLDDRGDVQEWMGSLIDIHERKVAEAEREQLLSREQAAREQAETANRIKDEFLAVLSHELRSPLNPILGWTKLLQTRKFDEQATKRALEIIERNAKLQTQLIADLLDISRILQGKMVLNVSPVDLIETTEAAIETVQLAADAKGITIQTRAANLAPVSGDSARLQQIIWNLLTNAIKFTPEGGSVEVQIEQIGAEAQITVKDTGKGINREFLPYVFEYFRQEDSTTTRKFGGLGLGLAIVRYLTELHGGTVRVDSPGEGLGATFQVRLPLLQVKARQRQDAVPLLPAESSPLIGLRILVVDDEADMQELVVAILEQAGATAMVAASATEAIAAFDSFTPDVLISDIGMPNMDGYALMRQIKERSPAGKNILAIALTAYAGEGDRQQAEKAGFQCHLAKPVEPDQLVAATLSLLGKTIAN